MFVMASPVVVSLFMQRAPWTLGSEPMVHQVSEGNPHPAAPWRFRRDILQINGVMFMRLLFFFDVIHDARVGGLIDR